LTHLRIHLFSDRRRTGAWALHNAAAFGGDGLIVPAEHYYYIAVSFIVIIWAHGGSVKENNPPRHPSEEGIIAKGCLPEKKRK